MQLCSGTTMFVVFDTLLGRLTAVLVCRQLGSTMKKFTDPTDSVTDHAFVGTGVEIRSVTP